MTRPAVNSSIRWFTLALGAGSLLMAALGLWEWRRYQRADAIVTTSIVTEHGRTNTHLLLEYRHQDGSRYTVPLPPGRQTNEPLRVVYDPQYPKEAQVESFDMVSKPLFAGVIGLGLTGAGLFLRSRPKLPSPDAPAPGSS